MASEHLSGFLTKKALKTPDLRRRFKTRAMKVVRRMNNS
jgi:hypothetical protein